MENTTHRAADELLVILDASETTLARVTSNDTLPARECVGWVQNPQASVISGTALVCEHEGRIVACDETTLPVREVFFLELMQKETDVALQFMQRIEAEGLDIYDPAPTAPHHPQHWDIKEFKRFQLSRR